MFGDTRLVVSSYSTERDGLLGLSNSCAELFGVEDSVVSVVVTHSNAVGLGIFLKAFLSLNGVLRVRSAMHMDIGKAGNMVDEYRGGLVSLASKSAGILRDKAGNGGV